MKILSTAIEGVLILEPTKFEDSRGYFFESYSKRELDEAAGYEINFVQDNQSSSKRGVIRGLHFQRPPHTQAKLVRCIHGSVIDVAVDLRKGSPTYGKHVAVELSSTNLRQLFIPRGFAHGFAVRSELAVFQYKCDNYYCPESEGGISIKDTSLGIDWGIDIDKAVLSEKDLRLPLFKDFDSCF